jgi:outer membrane protein OmpA-like peptidoglycan-associated protein
LLPAAYDRVRSLARTLNAYPHSRVIIKGHTDSTGDERFNQTLSAERADTVRKFLVTEGVGPSRITAIGFGEQMPTATNNTPEGRQQNRRVEIEIRPEENTMSGALDR